MSRSLPPGFVLREGDASDSTEQWLLCIAAMVDDAIWQMVFKDCKKEDIERWVLGSFPHRWLLPDITLYKIVEESSGRMAGWTALQFPWADRPLKEDELAIVNSHDLPPGIEGMNMEALPVFIECLSFAGNHGYVPQTDYHRKGTMIHPEFQKRGLGTCLTDHCNAIADKTGGKTWAPARPSSVKMFRQCGFKDVATHDAHLEKWGGNPDKNFTYLVLREASK